MAVTRHEINHVGGEVFSSMDEPSVRSVLWGELFKEKERTFLRKELKEETACFSIQDTFQMAVRAFWQPEARVAKGGHRHGKFVTMLHGIEYPLVSSWVWVKLVRPLYRKGFSVIAIDLPGFGRSKMNMDPSVKLEAWLKDDWHLICQTLDNLRVPCTHMVATGAQCATIFRMFMGSPHSLEKEHFFYNPSFNAQEVFADLVGPPPPGVGKDWRSLMRLRYEQAVTKILKNSKARIWSVIDREWAGHQATETQDLLAAAAKHPVLSPRMKLQDVTKNDLCVSHIGANLPMSFLYFCRALQNGIVQFFDDREKPTDVMIALPKFVPFKEIGAEEEAVEDDEDNDDDPRTWGFAPASSQQTWKSGSTPTLTRAASLGALSTVPARPNSKQISQLDIKELQKDLKPGTVEMARSRMGAEGYGKLRWTASSQSKHSVRDLESRAETCMMESAKESKYLHGGNPAEFRVQLLSRLTRTQQHLVWASQSKQEEEKDVVETYKPPGSAGSLGVSAKSRKSKTPGSSPPSTAQALSSKSLTGTTPLPGVADAQSRSASNLLALASPGRGALAVSGQPRNARSSTNLSFADDAGGAKGNTRSGSMGSVGSRALAVADKNPSGTSSGGGGNARSSTTLSMSSFKSGVSGGQLPQSGP